MARGPFSIAQMNKNGVWDLLLKVQHGSMLGSKKESPDFQRGWFSNEIKLHGCIFSLNITGIDGNEQILPTETCLRIFFSGWNSSQNSPPPPKKKKKVPPAFGFYCLDDRWLNRSASMVIRELKICRFRFETLQKQQQIVDVLLYTSMTRLLPLNKNNKNSHKQNNHHNNSRSLHPFHHITSKNYPSYIHIFHSKELWYAFSSSMFFFSGWFHWAYVKFYVNSHHIPPSSLNEAYTEGFGRVFFSLIWSWRNKPPKKNRVHFTGDFLEVFGGQKVKQQKLWVPPAEFFESSPWQKIDDDFYFLNWLHGFMKWSLYINWVPYFIPNKSPKHGPRVALFSGTSSPCQVAWSRRGQMWTGFQ